MLLYSLWVCCQCPCISLVCWRFVGLQHRLFAKWLGEDISFAQTCRTRLTFEIVVVQEAFIAFNLIVNKVVNAVCTFVCALDRIDIGAYVKNTIIVQSIVRARPAWFFFCACHDILRRVVLAAIVALYQRALTDGAVRCFCTNVVLFSQGCVIICDIPQGLWHVQIAMWICYTVRVTGSLCTKKKLKKYCWRNCSFLLQ